MTIIHAMAIDATGRARMIDSADAPLEGGEWRWLHLDRTSPDADTMLAALGIDADERAVLLSEETRPRHGETEDGTIVILRGVNMNPGAALHDTLALRLLLRPDLMVTLRRDPIFAVSDLAGRYRTGPGPATPFELLAAIAQGLTRRIAQAVEGFDDRLDALEEEAVTAFEQGLRERLLDLRRHILPVRRYILPQRDALQRLSQASIDGLDTDTRDTLTHLADETQRILETLDSLRERAALLGEEIGAALADRLNRNTYALSIIAAIFLPLGFLTGLLGINVGGIPGTENPAAFWIVVALCVASAALVIGLMRHARLM